MDDPICSSYKKKKLHVEFVILKHLTCSLFKGPGNEL